MIFREAVKAASKVHDGYPLSSSEESSIDLEEAWGTTEQSGDDSRPRDLIITEEDSKKISLINQKRKNEAERVAFLRRRANDESVVGI